jgi:hypothetical protein
MITACAIVLAIVCVSNWFVMYSDHKKSQKPGETPEVLESRPNMW